VKNTFDWVVRALFLVVGVTELFLGITGRFPSNLGPLGIGAAILCWLAVRWRADQRRGSGSGGGEPPA
jgi:hypothetical protein